MATIKINPARLPYRGEPTKEIRIIEEAPVRRDLDSSYPSWRFPTKEERRRPRADAWTPEQDQKIWKMYYGEKKTPRQIGTEIGRTKNAVKTRLQRLRERNYGKTENESTE